MSCNLIIKHVKAEMSWIQEKFMYTILDKIRVNFWQESALGRYNHRDKVLWLSKCILPQNIPYAFNFILIELQINDTKEREREKESVNVLSRVILSLFQIEMKQASQKAAIKEMNNFFFQFASCWALTESMR